MIRILPAARALGVAAATLALIAGFTESAVTAASAAPEPRIVGGTEASITDAPWQVALLQDLGEQSEGKRYVQFCGGSIIDREWVLTAAHCVVDERKEKLVVLSGSATLPQDSEHTGTLSRVRNAIVHPEYDPFTVVNDIALIRLAEPLPPTVEQSPIALPGFTNWPTRGTDALITGWGSTGSWGERPTHLRKATVQVIASPTQPRCEEYPRGNYVPALMLCAGIPRTGGIGTCQGDSGGPLAVTVNGIPYLAGVTSFGRGCAEPGYPGVFARVTSYTSWIARTQRTPPGSLRVSTTTRLPRDADFCVRVFNADTRSDAPIGGACAAAGGRTVTIPDLMPGRYEIVADDGREGAGSVVPTWWSPRGPQADRSRAGVVIVRSAEQSDVQATVVVGNAIAVEVSPDAYDRDPRSRTCLSAYAVGFDSQAATTCSPMRFSAGRFVYFLIGLPAGRYDVRARDRSGIYRTQWYPGVPLKAQAISVPVATREVTHVAMDVSRFTTRPGPVGNLRATVSPGPGSGSHARITWDYPLKSGGLEVTEYRVVITRGRTEVLSTTVIADTEVSIPYLLPGTYVATVRAVNRLGPGRAARVTFPVSRPSAR